MPPSNSPGRGERSPLPHSLISRPREDASSQYLASSAGCTKSVVNMTHSGNSVPHRSSTSSGGIPRRLALKINSYLQGKSHNQDNHVASMNLFPATPFRMHPVLAYTICYDVMYPPTPLTVVDRNTRASVPPQTLQQPATDPVTLSRLVLTSDKFPWLVVARSRPGNSNNSRPSGKSFFKKRSPSNAILSSAPVTNFDVLRSLHETLYMRVTQEEWDALGSRKRMKIWKAHEARCEPAGDGGMADIRRVDYLGEETILVGVEVDGLTEGGRLVFARPYPAAKNRDKPTMPSIVMIKDHSNEKICIINQM
ncbi:hypothetical protein DL96DRAFT_1531629 [Flagelloscypha sp. PMI_526]|nr:hypothetical protein DL96DRAFT_1531629 [Flagelloscypha sp. PMI_526]